MVVHLEMVVDLDLVVEGRWAPLVLELPTVVLFRAMATICPGRNKSHDDDDDDAFSYSRSSMNLLAVV